MAVIPFTYSCMIHGHVSFHLTIHTYYCCSSIIPSCVSILVASLQIVLWVKAGGLLQYCLSRLCLYFTSWTRHLSPLTELTHSLQSFFIKIDTSHSLPRHAFRQQRAGQQKMRWWTFSHTWPYRDSSPLHMRLHRDHSPFSSPPLSLFLVLALSS